MLRLIKKICLIVALSVIIAPAAKAHKVSIFAWAEGNTVYTESKFSGGKVVKGGKVEVFDPSGALLLEGQTSDTGAFAFKAPRLVDLTVVLTAGMGHRNSWSISAAELGGGMSQPAPEAPPETETDLEPVSSEKRPGLTAQDIESIVARQLDQKIQPLMRLVATSSRPGASLSDIIGGIGYIVGLVGVGAYFRYRRDGRRS